MAEIRLSGVNKVYPGGTHAVHDVDLHIADGEFMIMVGPSGCAKSTILRMIAGLETPTGGTVEIGGRVVNDVAPKDRDIAMVFQSYALYPHMTVRENMAFGLRLRRMPEQEIQQRVAEAARILGLEHLLDRLPKAMSGGQRQRVAMGRAIVREPQAFLMDEPLSNLDAKLRVQMRTEIAKLHQRLRTTTVYVTHDQVEALTLGQRICILRKGVVQQVDTPFQVYTNPANVFVGGFIGSPGMNFMNGHLVLHDGTLYLRLGDHHLPVPGSVASRLLATTDLHGRGVIVGIRPEHLSLAPTEDHAALPVQVELTEAMGAEVYAYFTAGVSSPDLTALSDTQATSETFVARLGAGCDAPAGTQIWLRPDMDEVHLFDPQTMLTMLAPADEAEVRARQTGAAIEVSATRPGLHGGVAAPSGATLAHHVQPVIHLHQTFVQPEPAFPAAEGSPNIASVFDRQVASPVTLQPLVPHAAAVGEGPYAGASPVTNDSAVAAHPRPSFAGALMGERPSPPAFVGQARPSMVHLMEPTAAPTEGAALATEPMTDPALDDLESRAASRPVEADAAEAAPAAPRGFAPRYIGTDDEADTPTHEVAEDEPAPQVDEAPLSADEHAPAATLRANSSELDAAIDALEEPEHAQLEHAPETVEASPQASSAFRDALTRIRAERPATSPPTLPVGRVLPPPVTLSPTTDDPARTIESPIVPPMTFRVPRIAPSDTSNSTEN